MFNVTGNTTIICSKNISFGNDCLLSWDILIMDDDKHPIFDQQHARNNNAKPISIGNNIWIGCRSTLLKGTSIVDGTIIASCSIVYS